MLLRAFRTGCLGKATAKARIVDAYLTRPGVLSRTIPVTGNGRPVFALYVLATRQVVHAPPTEKKCTRTLEEGGRVKRISMAGLMRLMFVECERKAASMDVVVMAIMRADGYSVS